MEDLAWVSPVQYYPHDGPCSTSLCCVADALTNHYEESGGDHRVFEEVGSVGKATSTTALDSF